jgi:hypothetical protein
MPATTNSLRTAAPLWQRIAGALRLSTALVCAVALVFRFQWGLGSITFEPANFFAYLTIQSNIGYVIVAAIAGVLALRGRPAHPRFDALRAGVLTCTVTAGIVFALIVQQSAARGIRVDVPWSDVVLHFVLPVIAVADWMLTPRARTRLTVIVFVLGYVGVWGGITIVRGDLTGWYPYYFLDPIQTSSTLEFLLISGIAIAVFAAVGAALVLIWPGLARYPSERKGRGSGERTPAEQRRRGRSVRARSRRPQRRAAPGARSTAAD